MLTYCQFKHTYSSGFEEPKDFFTEALIESASLDLGLGFFSSSGINSLAYGFAVFIAHGGKMRVVINDILSEKDKRAIENGQKNCIEDFEDRLITDIEKLIATLSLTNHQFFKCLSYLISIKRIEFIATVSSKGGLGHDKYGVFTDEGGNKVAFIGSANFSLSALERNGETITVFTSWDDHKRVVEYQDLFNRSWQEDTPHLIHIPLEKVKTHISGRFKTETLRSLIQEGVSLRDLQGLEEKPVRKTKPLSSRVLERLEVKEQEPLFPFPDERTIQREAYDSWVQNNFCGIFAMATGTGKTVTALNCLLKRYRIDGVYKAIIVVPTQSLALQWEQEVRSFNFQNVVSTHTDKDWKTTIARYTTRSLFDQSINIIIITTYATFNRSEIQNFVRKTKGLDSFVYIADEAHNIGSPNTLSHLPQNIKFRIGLSATPERVYDDVGSNMVYLFFNSHPPKYTYRFTMKQAIDEKILCHYDYHPIFIELTEVEMVEYAKITRQLYKYIDPKTRKYKKEAEKLLLKRKRVIHKAENKKVAIAKLLSELESVKRLNYTFVFVPEGYEPDYGDVDNYDLMAEDMHIIDDYASMFKENGYRYYKFIGGLAEAAPVLKSFADGDIDVLLSMKCLDEGVDIPRAESAIFCSSTGNPRQFVQRRGRVLRRSKEKERAVIWDLIVKPPEIDGDPNSIEKNMFMGEVKRIVNFAALADNQIDILYGELKQLCEYLNIDLFNILEVENQQYK